MNLYAQFSYGTQMRHLDYEALELGLTRLVARFRDQKVYPKIGTYYMVCNSFSSFLSLSLFSFSALGFVFHFSLFLFNLSNFPLLFFFLHSPFFSFVGMF